MPKQNERLTWEPPPQPDRVKRHPWMQGAAAKLKRRKGEWAHVATYDTPQSAASVAYLIRAGSRHFAPAGAFEAKARTVDGERRVYARYVGEGEMESERSTQTAPGGA